MMFLKRLAKAALMTAALGLLSVTGAEAQPLRIGVAANASNAALEAAVKAAKDQGFEAKIVEFTDWNTPNIALKEGSIDVNFYQHIPFLENVKQANGYDFVPVGIGFTSVSGIYSAKVKSLSDVPDDATVTISNDATNAGRALLLLQQAGLIKLRPGATYSATPQDIVENPKRLKIVPLEAQQVVRSIQDAYLAVTFPSFLRLVGIDPNNALFYETPDEIYAIRWVVRRESEKDPRIQRFIKIYQSTPAVKEALTKLYGKLVVFSWDKQPS